MPTRIINSLSQVDPWLYLNLNKIDGFHQTRLGSQGRSIQDPPGSRDDLSSPTMDGISMESHILNVKTDPSHVLFAQNALRPKHQIFRASETSHSYFSAR
ncbi:hypothetical protein E2320_017882 [Naja naja]|nr:hypothetical protein E2320_017882 [Naja naja]